jgi:hypothetical protein
MSMHHTIHRPVAIVTAVVFSVSAIFPLVAGFVRDTQSWPKWWGALDVGLAFILAGLVLAIAALARARMNQRTEEVTYRAYRVLIHGILVGLVVFFLAGDRIIWSQCLTGFLWRAWLLLYAFPWWVAAYRATPSTDA